MWPHAMLLKLEKQLLLASWLRSMRFRVMVRLWWASRVMENYRVPFIISPTHWELLGANALLQRFRKKERKNLNATLVTGFSPTTTNRLLPGCSVGRPRCPGNWGIGRTQTSRVHRAISPFLWNSSIQMFPLTKSGKIIKRCNRICES